MKIHGASTEYQHDEPGTHYLETAEVLKEDRDRVRFQVISVYIRYFPISFSISSSISFNCITRACTPSPKLSTNTIHLEQVKPSEERAWSSSSDWHVRTFVRLFPFGMGGPDEKRLTHVGKEACIRHYLRLSTGAFQGYEFNLHAYDAIARAKQSSQAFASCNYKTSSGNTLGEKFGQLSPETMEETRKYLEQCDVAAKSCKPRPSLPPGLDPTGQEFARTVRKCSKAAKHTAASQSGKRQGAIAMSHTFGKPTWWITWTPNALNSITI
jgi:hypothetical protein